MILIHIIPEIRGLKIDRSRLRRIETEKLREMEAGLKKEGVSSVEIIVRFGIPFERIIEYSDELDVNLIVMGSGKSGKKFPLGITAERVITYADKPVLAVKPGTQTFIRKVLCPVDFSEASKRALINSLHLSRTFGAHLTVLTVLETPLKGFWERDRGRAASSKKDLIRRQEHQYDRFLRGFESEDLTWSKTVREGEPHEEILRAAREARPDLLVMGSHGRTGLLRYFMGSTTERVVREMPCSVMTLKQEHVIRFPLEKEMAGIEAGFKRGKELLEKQAMEKAAGQFEYCIRKDPLFIPAWEGMAAAYEYMGKKKEANRCAEMAAHIRKHLWK